MCNQVAVGIDHIGLSVFTDLDLRHHVPDQAGGFFSLESGKTLNELGGSAQLFATANTFARRRHDWQEESRF
jgi:hypothetical protein